MVSCPSNTVGNATVNTDRSTVTDVNAPGFNQTLVFECSEGHRFSSDLATERTFTCIGSDWSPNDFTEACEGWEVAKLRVKSRISVTVILPLQLTATRRRQSRTVTT